MTTKKTNETESKPKNKAKAKTQANDPFQRSFESQLYLRGKGENKGKDQRQKQVVRLAAKDDN
jgi:hypothetical protein